MDNNDPALNWDSKRNSLINENQSWINKQLSYQGFPDDN